MKTSEIYQTVTNQIIELLENHQLTYNQPWIKVGNDFKPAHNANSGYVYNGINQLLLSIIAQKFNYPTSAWLTMYQANQLGAKVIKGSKSCNIYFYKAMYLNANKKIVADKVVKKMSEDEIDSLTKIPYLKAYRIFNVAQIEGLPEKFYPQIDSTENVTINEFSFEDDYEVEQIIKSTGAEIEFGINNLANYNILEDKIYLPFKENFKGKNLITQLHYTNWHIGQDTKLV